MPVSTSRTPCSTFSGVIRLTRPNSSSSPQSPQVEPVGRCFQRCGTGTPLYGLRGCVLYRPVGLLSAAMTNKDFVVWADGHILEPIDLFRTRMPAHLRDRAVWEEDFEIDPLVEGGARVFRRLHTPGFEGWTISRYRQTSGRTPEGDP